MKRLLLMLVSMVAMGVLIAAAPLEFEVASIKPNTIGNAGGEGSARENIISTPDTLTMGNVSLASAIKWAYGLHDYQLTGPAWLNSERYDILAKAPGPASNDQLRLMLRTLLADRFKVTVHRQNKELPVYALLVAKNGPKLHKSQGAPDGGAGVMRRNGLRMVAEKVSMPELADLLSGPLQTPVVDMTALKGRFDFTLDLSTFIAATGTGKQGDQRPPDMTNIIFTAVQEQLGLTLRAQKAPIEILVVDGADKIPTHD